MNAIEELKTEHEAVRQSLKILRHMCLAIETSGEIAEPTHLEQLFEFFSRFVDRCHHGKEEDLLFPAMEAVGVSRQGGPIGVMLKEHQLGRDQVLKMKCALALYREGRSEAARTLALHARTYIELLNQHIDKENEVLFVIAARHLSSEKLAELEKGFDQIESQRIGAGRHEAFHRMLECLQKAYPAGA